jgi:hypothetical protein
MRRGIACAAVIAAVMSAHVATASADYLCVPSISIPGCPVTGSANEPTIQDAVKNASTKGGDIVLIGADTYNGGHPYDESVDDMGKSLTFIGAGPTKTVIQGQGVTAMNISSGSDVQNLGIDLGNGPGNTGLSLAGHASNIAITATQPASTMNNIGVALNGGAFSHGSITLPLSGGDIAGYGGAIGKGTLTDSSVTAAVGITDDSFGNLPTVRRVRVLANQGVVDNAFASAAIDDLLIRTTAGAAPETGLAVIGAIGSLTARHLTVIGSGSSASTGVDASGNNGALLLPGTVTVTLESSILRGYSHSIAASAVAGISTNANETTIVNVRHSIYAPTTDTTTSPVTGPPSASAAILADSHSGNFNPLFVDAPTGDFRLQAGSPAIDGGEATLGTGESTTDLDGNPRRIAGHKGDAAISDVGAYEFRPHAPTVKATTTTLKIAPGKKDTFHASGSDLSPGDAVRFRWTFGDASAATGAVVSHSFAKAGHHHVTVTATDLDGFTSAASLTITVPGPAVSKLSIEPHRFRVRHGARIAYTASQPAATTFKVIRAKTGKLVSKFTHRGAAGKNHLHFAAKAKAHALAPGRYRLVAIPHNAAGTGRPVSVRFTIAG